MQWVMLVTREDRVRVVGAHLPIGYGKNGGKGEVKKNKEEIITKKIQKSKKKTRETPKKEIEIYTRKTSDESLRRRKKPKKKPEEINY